MLRKLRTFFENSFRIGIGNRHTTRGFSTQRDHDRIFQFLIRNTKEGIFWTDESGRILGCNDAICDLLGFSRDELKQMVVADIDSQITDESHQDLLRKLSQQPSVTVQTQPRRKDGTHVTVEFTVTRLVIDERVYLCTCSREIDLEKQLRNQVLEALATGMPLSEILSLIIQLAEKTWSRMLGSILLVDESGCFRHAAATRLPRAFCEKIDGTKPGPGDGSFSSVVFNQTDVLLTEHSQSPIWEAYLELAEIAGVKACWSQPIFSARNKVLGIIAMYFLDPQVPTDHDKELMKTLALLAGIAIERARKNEQFLKNELRNRSLVQSSAATVWTSSPQGDFIDRQESWESYTGQPWEEHRGFGWWEMIHVDDRARLVFEWTEAIEKPEPFESHGRMWHAQSSGYRYFEVHAVPIIRDNQVIEWVGSTTDVHNRKIAENSLVRSRAILTQAQEVAHLGSWVWDFESDRVQWTEEFCRLHGFDLNDLTGDVNRLMKTVLVGDRPKIRNAIRRTLETGVTSPMEYRILRHDGSMRTVLSKTKFETDNFGNNSGLIGTVLDVTNLRKTEKALRQSERQIRTITDSLPVMIAYIDTNYRYRFINGMYELLFKKRRSDIIGRHVSELVGEAVFQKVKHHFDAAFRGMATTYQQRIEVPSGQSQISEVRLIPDKNSKGVVVGVYTLIDDITKRQALEKEVLNIAAKEQRRIGQDLHDGTGQELTGLGMIADALLLSLSRKGADEQPIAEKLARGIKNTLQQVRSLARGLNPVDISSEGLRSALTQMAEHVEDLYSTNCRFLCDSQVKLQDNQIATQLFRIAQEATTNAAKHGHAKNVTIRLLESKQEIVLSVTDDGVGIHPDVQESPGMGLRTMNYRANAIGGRFQIARREGGGTEVLCKLSLSDSDPLGMAVGPQEQESQSTSENKSLLPARLYAAVSDPDLE